MVALSSATFKASGHDTKLSFANQLRRYVNVRGFGALGDGVNDDWHAIKSAVNWSANESALNIKKRGTVYLPRGTYKISQSIAFLAADEIVNIEGEPGTIITGNFGDFLIKFDHPTLMSTVARATVGCLELINTHASGGGIRFAVTGGTIRDCIVTANQGINTSLDDDTWGGFETDIFNCHLDPGDNAASSNGLLLQANGIVSNCTMTGFACGARHFGGQGGAHLVGCTFELCTTGIAPGTIPSGANDSAGNWAMLGCRFVHCGTAVHPSSGSGNCQIEGIHIGAAEGTGNPQYGIRIATTRLSSYAGINITGQYQVAGFAYTASDSYRRDNVFAGIGVTNTSSLGGVAWTLPLKGHEADFIACNTAPVFTVTQLPAQLSAITAATWSGGTATITIAAGHGMVTASPGANIVVAGVTPSGYNGTFLGANVTNSTTITYAVADPGGAGSAFGTVFATGVSSGTANSYEGESFNVSDSNTATWGATYATGGANRVKVRNNGTSWTVVGK